MKVKQIKEGLKKNLAMLSKPKHDYQVEIPEEVLI